MSDIAGKTVIVTGASSGIGAATAKKLAENGAKVMLAARHEDRLKDLVGEIGGDAKYRVTDVSSVAGLRTGPATGVYSGTKHAVRAISEGLRQENRR